MLYNDEFMYLSVVERYSGILFLNQAWLLTVAAISRQNDALLLICINPPSSLHYFYVKNIAH